jgi:hypothetical protein
MQLPPSMSTERPSSAGSRSSAVRPTLQLPDIHGLVGAGERLFGRVLGQQQRAPDRRAQPEVGASEWERRCRDDGLEHAALRLHPGLVYLPENHPEFIPAKTSERVGCPHVLAQNGCEMHESLIAGLVALAVVQKLEPIKIREKQGDRGPIAFAKGDRPRELPEKTPPVQEMGERVLLSSAASRSTSLRRAATSARTSSLSDTVTLGLGFTANQGGT